MIDINILFIIFFYSLFLSYRRPQEYSALGALWTSRIMFFQEARAFLVYQRGAHEAWYDDIDWHN